MTVLVSNTSLEDNLDTWRLNTNLAATTISNNTITVERNGRGGHTVGNGHVTGTLSANALKTQTISGGNTSSDSGLTVSSNLEITGTELTISSNTSFSANVDMSTITGTNRLFLPDASRIRMTGGVSGQYVKIANDNQLGFSFIQFRDFNELQTNTLPILLSGANTLSSFEGSADNSPPIHFTTSGGEEAKIFLASSGTFNEAYLINRLSDAGGLSEWQLRNSSNALLHSMSSDGKVVFNSSSVGASVSIKSQGSGTVAVFDADNNTTLFNGTILANNTVEFNQPITAYGDVTLGSDQSDDINIRGRLLLNDQELLGGASGFSFAGDVNMQSNVVIGSDENDTLHINATVANTVFGENVVLGNDSGDEILVNGSMKFNESVIPNTDDAFDLGSATKEWKDIYIDGVAYIDELQVATGATQGLSSSLIPKTNATYNLGSVTRSFNNIYGQSASLNSATITNTLGVTGDTTFKKVSSGNTTITGDLTVTGDASLNGVTIDSINSTDDSTFQANVQIDGSLTVGGDATITGNLTFGNAPTDTITMEGQFANSFTSDLKAQDVTVYGNTVLGTHLTDEIVLNGTVTGITSNGTSSFNGPVNFNDEIVVQGHFANQQTTGMSNFQNIIVDSTGDWIGSPDSPEYGLQVNTKSKFKNDIDATNVNIDNLQVTGSFILPSDVEIAQANGLFTDSLRSFGNTVIGNQLQDELYINSTVQTDIIPVPTANLGSESSHWKSLYANSVYASEQIVWGDGINKKNVIYANGSFNTTMIPLGSIDSGHLENTSVVAGTYGNSAAVASFTVDEDGRITAASNIAVAGVSSFVFTEANNTLTLGTSSGDNFYADIGALEVVDGSITSAKLETLAGLVSGEYGNSSAIPVVNVNEKGQVTSITTAQVAGVDDLTYYQANSTLQLDTADGGSLFTKISDVTPTQKGIAKFDTGEFDIVSGSVSLKDTVNGAVLGVNGTANEIEVARNNGTVTVGLPDRVQIADDLDVVNDVTAGSLFSEGGASITNNLSVGGDTSVTGQLSVTANSALGNTSINGDLDVASTSTFAQDVIVQGDLLVKGSTTTLTTNELIIDDNIITLANGQSTGALDAGIEIDRGSDPTVSVLWKETANRWSFTNDGTNFYSIPTPSEYDVGIDTKYSIQAVATSGGAKIQLAANDFVTNIDGEVSILGGGGTNVSRTGDTITVSSTDTDTVTRLGYTGSDYQSGDIKIVGSGATSVAFDGDTFTISSTDTDTNDYVDGANLSGNILTLSRTGSLNDLTVDLSSLTPATPTLDDILGAGSSTTKGFTTTGTVTADSFNGTSNLNLTRDGESVLKASSGEIVVNDGSRDRNFRVETDADQYGLFVDAGTNRVGVGTGTPEQKLDVSGNVKASRFIGSIDWDNIDGDKPSEFSFSISDTDNTSTVIDSGETVKYSGSDGIEVDLTASTNQLTFGLSTSASYRLGSLGVGTSASGTSGEIRATNDIIAYYSDDRLKDMQGTIPDALAKVNSLNGYYYTENETAKELGYDNDARQVGVSAQEVEQVLPEIVKEAPIDPEYKTVQYEKLVPLLIEAIKELSAEIDELKKNK